jgi:IS30 family transposase
VPEASGGIAPAPRTRSQRVLRFGEREEISRGLAAGDSLRAIAMRLNRAVSTVSQEVARHGGRMRYLATQPIEGRVVGRSLTRYRGIL